MMDFIVDEEFDQNDIPMKGKKSKKIFPKKALGISSSTFQKVPYIVGDVDEIFRIVHSTSPKQ